MSAPYQITGVVLPNSSDLPKPLPPPPCRLNITELQKDEKQFALFILAFNKIMEPGFKPVAASFHEIAGIHGMPYVPWAGEPDEVRQSSRAPWLGYCNHASILFPHWHRPYLMLLEQIISDVAFGIASEFTNPPKKSGYEDQENLTQAQKDQDAEDWMTAATQLRLPFWDWTQQDIPQIFKDPKVELNIPFGEKIVHNPLACYHFEVGDVKRSVDGFNNRWQAIGGKTTVYKHSARSYYRDWPRTFRNPGSMVHTEDNYAGISKIFEEDQYQRGSLKNLRADVAGMFKFPHGIDPRQCANAWDEFSNTTFQSAHQDPNKPKEITSPYSWGATPLEQSHNTVHLLVGGIGHMADNDTAAFDPIFFLHHCNVDRLLAFWEHIYPEYTAGTQGYLQPDGITRAPFTQSGGTWLEAEDQEVHDQSPLWPFRNSNYRHWNSQDSHSLMYTSDPDAPASVYNKYYTYPDIVDKEGHRVKIDTDPAKRTELKVREQQRRYLQNYFDYAPQKGPNDSKYHREYFVRVSLHPAFVEGSHSLVVSIKVGDKPYKFGSVAVLSRGASDKCGNCQAQRAGGVRVRGIVPIPYEQVSQLQVATLTDEGEGTDKDLAGALKGALGAELVLLNGLVHSNLADTGRGAAEVPLSNNQTPHLELVSCAVYQKSGSEDSDVPYDFEDWQYHGELGQIERNGETFERGWVLGYH
ncbi:hypothetical protein RSOLAG22IIIB_12197 [Rhizoctonia solani]|uniref:tyrosinase n=1 Tax=Rhizoctonia solani TaxID=456999 RepID=A0A0K6GD51_9AGAM|nr:hypothetical protein RSOLAG22IIIB_12197 [Rhizoctonia solani]